MIRINVQVDDQVVTLHLEGRLVEQTVSEAARCWETSREDNPGKPCRMDLRSVTFIDPAGRKFLKQVFQQGASFLYSGCLTRAYVEEITDSGKEQAVERHAERSAP